VTLTPTGRSSRLQEAIPPTYGPRAPLPHTFVDSFGDLAPLKTTATDTSSSFSSRAATLTLDCALVAKFNSPPSVTLPMDMDPLTPESIPVASPSAPPLMELSSESSGDEIFRPSGRPRAPIYSSDSESDTPKSVPERPAQSSADPQVLLTRLSPSIIKKYKRVPFRIPKKIQSSSPLVSPGTQGIKSSIKRTNPGGKDQHFGGGKKGKFEKKVRFGETTVLDKLAKKEAEKAQRLKERVAKNRCDPKRIKAFWKLAFSNAASSEQPKSPTATPSAPQSRSATPSATADTPSRHLTLVPLPF